MLLKELITTNWQRNVLCDPEKQIFALPFIVMFLVEAKIICLNNTIDNHSQNSNDKKFLTNTKKIEFPFG